MGSPASGFMLGWGACARWWAVCPDPAVAAGLVSWALQALRWEALASHCFLAMLPSVLALGFVRLSVGAGQLFRKMGVTRRLVCVKGIGSVPFGKDFVDLKDTANLWSI